MSDFFNYEFMIDPCIDIMMLFKAIAFLSHSMSLCKLSNHHVSIVVVIVMNFLFFQLLWNWCADLPKFFLWTFLKGGGGAYQTLKKSGCYLNFSWNYG